MTPRAANKLVKEGFEFRVSTGSDIAYVNAPVAMGVSLPQGGLVDVSTVRAFDSAGKPHPVQATALAHWPDGSVKWALVEMPADVPAAPPLTRAVYRVRFGVPARPARGDVRVRQNDDEIVVANRRLSVRFDRRRFAIVRGAALDGQPVIRDGDPSDIIVEDEQGKQYLASLASDYRAEVEHAGPVRTTVRLSGKHTAADGSTLLDFRLRVSIFHKLPDLLIEHQFTNREDALPGVKLKSLRLAQELNVGRHSARAVRQLMHGADTIPRPIGGIRQNVSIHVGTPLCKALDFHGPLIADPEPFNEDFSVMDFHIRDYPSVRYGAGSWIDVSGRAEGRTQGATIFLRNFGENHPKIIESSQDQVALWVVPQMNEPLHYMQGWSKRHEVVYCFHRGADQVDPVECDKNWFRWEHRPAVTAPFAWYQHSGVEEMDKIMPPSYRKYPILETKLMWVPRCGGSTGMIHWGDLYTEAGRWGPGGAGWNHEEDPLYGQFLLALRNEDAGRFADTCVCVRHQIDIDSISYSQDPLRCGAIAPHSRDHVRGATYPSHMWITGMTLYHYLTGDPDAREAAIAQAEVNLRFIEKRWNATTLTGREHGWPILNLGFVYELTRDPKYLAGAMKLIADVERRLDQYGGVYYHHHPYEFGQFANYSIYEGIYKVWQQTGDQKLKALFLRVVDWLITTGSGARGFSYCRNGQWFANLFPLAMAHHMTGDEKYAQAGKIGLILMMTYHPIDTWCLRELLHFLAIADKRGWIEQVQPQNAQ